MKTNCHFWCCTGHDFIILSRIVAMLNDMLQIYLLMIFKLTHIYLLNLEIEMANKTILSF